jgi:septal ring factor EnvC (AmiA/AmiB activator)
VPPLQSLELSMPSRIWLELAAILVTVILCVTLVEAWRADRRDRDQLNAELAATKQLVAAADARQHDREAQLAQTLAALATEKRTVVTPAQIVRELPREIPLPAPLVLQSAPTAPGQHLPGAEPSSATTNPSQAQVIIAAEDLKPLHDFTLDCQACQAKLASAQGDLADEKSKSSALTQERDQALKIARGGSAWRRIARAAKWFAIGAAAGAVAAKAAH